VYINHSGLDPNGSVPLAYFFRVECSTAGRPGELLLLISEHVPTEMEKPVASFR
jgi:hypothetical protein